MTPARKWLIAGAGVVIALVIALYLSTALRSGGTAPPGTSVQGVDISGMDEQSAAAAVQESLGPIARKRLRVTALGETFVVKPAAAGLGIDAAASVAPAFGRTWNPVDLISHLFGELRLPAVASVDQDALAAQVQVISEAINVAPEEPTLTVASDGETTLTPGIPGRALDPDVTAASLIEAVVKPRAPIPATVDKVEPSITPEAAQAAEELARTAVSDPVTVKAGSVTATIPVSAIGKALSFEPEGPALSPVLDGAVLHRSIRKALKPVEVKGSDATFKIRRGKVKVVPSKVGQGVSDAELSTAVAGVLALPAASRSVTVSIGVREPKLTTEQAAALGITEKISSFTQNFPYAAYRVQNIGEAARRVNATLLMPGETFSMNDTIKERTEKNGYTVGFVVGEGGVFDEALGGGVSTATTTVWTAAFFAGMERVQTVAHSIYISRYKPGLEATVAWGLFDMKFKNPYSDAVFITSSITNGSMTVSFWGTKVYDKIEAEFGERTAVVPYSKIFDDSDKCLGQNGVDGFTIVVDRVFYQGGEEVKRESITTRYKPAPDVTCGKKPEPTPSKPSKPNKPNKPSSEPSATPAASPTPVPADAPAGDAPPPADTFDNGSPSPSPTKKPKG
ncbi:MAG: VanW family protein [Actinobacteria bacterium]|nr:VanW family protein [Actinomycetota bacterium]